MPGSAVVMLRRIGREAFDVRSIGLDGANDTRIAAHAKAPGRKPF